MSAGISITERAGLLRVKVTGRRDADNIRSCWLKVGQACLGRNIKGVLFESHLSGTMPESDRFQVAERWQEYGLSGLK